MKKVTKKIRSIGALQKRVSEHSPELVKGLKRVFSNVLLKDPKTAISMMNETLRSIDAVHRYQTEGKQVLNLVEDQGLRKSDTLFILGSGPSVNELGDDEWQHIQQRDSWGFNFWFCNDFVPSAYIAQSAIRSPEDGISIKDLDRLMTDMLADKKQLYKDVPFILRGDGVNHGYFHTTEIGKFLHDHFSRLYYMPELAVSSKNKINIKKLLSLFQKNGLLETCAGLFPVPKFGSTIGELIPLALMLGYKKIVLCGIDMNDGGHFYDSQENFEKYPLLRTLSEVNNRKKGHEHMDKSVRTFTVRDIIIQLNEWAEKEMNARLFVSSRSSTLYPSLSQYIF